MPHARTTVVVEIPFDRVAIYSTGALLNVCLASGALRPGFGPMEGIEACAYCLDAPSMLPTKDSTHLGSAR